MLYFPSTKIKSPSLFIVCNPYPLKKLLHRSPRLCRMSPAMLVNIILFFLSLTQTRSVETHVICLHPSACVSAMDWCNSGLGISFSKHSFPICLFPPPILILHSVSITPFLCSKSVTESLLVWSFRHIFGITIFFHNLDITEHVADCSYLYSYICILARRLLSLNFCFKHLCLKSKSQNTLFNRSNSTYSIIFFNVSAFADSSDW